MNASRSLVRAARNVAPGGCWPPETRHARVNRVRREKTVNIYFYSSFKTDVIKLSKEPSCRRHTLYIQKKSCTTGSKSADIKMSLFKNKEKERETTTLYYLLINSAHIRTYGRRATARSAAE